MKTYSQIIASIKDQNIRDAILSNIGVEKLRHRASGVRAVLLSFSWANSKQSFDYWADLYSDIVDGKTILT